MHDVCKPEETVEHPVRFTFGSLTYVFDVPICQAEALESPTYMADCIADVLDYELIRNDELVAQHLYASVVNSSIFCPVVFSGPRRLHNLSEWFIRCLVDELLASSSICCWSCGVTVCTYGYVTKKNIPPIGDIFLCHSKECKNVAAEASSSFYHLLTKEILCDHNVRWQWSRERSQQLREIKNLKSLSRKLQKALERNDQKALRSLQKEYEQAKTTQI